MKRFLNLVLGCGATMALAVSSGQSGTVKFDGNDDRVLHSGFTGFPATAMTTEFWVKTTSAKPSAILSYASSAHDNEWQVWMNAGGNLEIYHRAGIVSGVNVNDGVWHHIAALWQSADGIVRIYKDGALSFVATNALLPGVPFAPGGTLMLAQEQDSVGGSLDPNQAFQGELDEVRIWTTYLAAADLGPRWNKPLSGNEPNLALCWTFDEGRGLVTADRSGNTRAGTLVGGPVWNELEEALDLPVAGGTIVSAVTDAGAMLRGAINPNGVPTTNRFEWGAGSTALEFDGVDDFVYVESGPVLTNRSFSIEFWARRDRANANAFEFPFSLGSAGSTRDLLHLGFRSATQITFAFFFDDLNTTVSADDLAWHHWAFTYDSATRQRRIYQNGLLVGQDIAGGHFIGTGPLRLGRYLSSNNQNAFAGAMDEVRVWKDVALSEATIRQWMNTEVNNTHSNFASLEAYWKLNEGSGRAAADSSGHGFNGQFVDNPVWAPGARPVFDLATPKQPVVSNNNVLNLDGVDDHVSVPAGIWFGGNFTIETWAYIRRYSSYERLLDFGNGTAQDNVLLSLSEGTTGRLQLWLYRGGAPSFLNSPVQVPMNQWLHLAATLQGSTATLYMNGAVIAQGIVNTPNAVVRSLNWIGRPHFPGETYADALMDEVRIWNTARSAAEIQAFMNQPVDPRDPTLLLNYRFDEPSGATVTDSRAVSPQNGTLVNGASRAPLVAGGSRLPVVDVGATLTGLTPGTVHHARAVAEGTNGASTGRSESFATLESGGGTTLAFDGVDDHARASRFGTQAPTTEVTVEFWQRVHSVREQSPFSLEPDLIGNRLQAHTPWANGIVYWDFGDINGAGRLSYTPPESLVGQWNHFAFVASQSGNFMRIYRNGVLEAQRTGMDTREAGNFDLILGRYTLSNVSRYFDGELDEFRLWNVARTEADIQRDLNERLSGSEAGLVAYYRMDEGAGPALVDSGPNGLHGLLNGGVDWLPSDAPVGLPVATTLLATGVGFGNATLNGTVNGEGTLPTAAWFEYGTQVAPVLGSAENQVSFFNIPGTVSSLGQINFGAAPASVQSFTNIDVDVELGPFWPGGPTERFAALYTGRIYLPAAGTYTFYLQSDDGSQLFIDGQLVVNHDGLHGPTQVSGSAYFPAGHHRFEVRYFELTVGAELKVFYSGPGIPKQIIPAEAFLRHDPVYLASTPVENLPANAVPVPLTAGLASLLANTTYHYRLVATNANGVSRAADQTFTMLHPGALTALNFDGVNDQVVVNSAAAQAGLRLSTNATWEAWINPTGPGSDATYGGIILNKEGEYAITRFPDGSIRYALALTTAEGRWTWISTGFIAPLSEWTHIALTYDGSMLRFYANGILVHTNARTSGSAAIDDAIPAMNEFRIGGRQGAGEFFNGMIDEVRVWNIARTPSEIQQYLSRGLTGAEPGLLAYYRFDEGSGNILDSGPRGYHGFTSGGPVGPPMHVTSAARLFQPQVTTLPATPVLATKATLRGVVNPSGTNTAAFFDYGPTIAYGSRFDIPNLDGIAPLSISVVVSNLEPGTTYHFRLGANNEAGTVYGADLTLNTLVLGCGWPISSTVNNGKATSPRHVVDPEGNAYVAGLFSGLATFKTTLQPQGGSGTNAFVGKLASGADWLWANQVALNAPGTMSINALAVDGARNVYVAGQFTGTATFGTNVLSSAGTGSDLFIAKLSSAGNAWLWARSTGGTNQPDSANALAVSGGGSVFVAGHFRGTSAFGTNSLSSTNGTQDIFVAKLDTDGNWLWARGAGGAGTNDSALALALSGAEEAFVAGRFQGSGNFGLAQLNAAGLVNDTDLFVARLDTTGTWSLAARGGGNGSDTATALAMDAAGQVYLLGQFTGTADYNGTVENLNMGGSPSSGRLFVAKLNPSGSMLWYAQAGSGFADSIAVDNVGRVYISGEFATSTQFGEPPAFTLISSGNADVFLAQLNADSGSWNWAKKIGASGSETRGSIGVDAEGGVVVSGSYQNTVQIGFVLLTSPNERDIFVARLTPDQVFEHNTYDIGQAIPVPLEAQDIGRTNGGAYRQPAITILEREHADSDAFNSFVWSLSENKLFAVRPVTAVFKWPLTDDITNTTRVATCVGRSVWPASPQFHVANAPVELEPPVPGFLLRVPNLAFTTVNGAAVDAGTKTFTAPTNGWSVIQFLNAGGAAFPNPQIHPTVFEVVRTVLWNDPAHLDDNQPALIGEALARPAHNDPTGKNGHVYFERAFYDGVGNERAYDRDTRTGPILPVNRDTAAADDDLVVIWYRVSPVTGIAWPDDPVRYLPRWPDNPDELVLASGAGSGVLDPLNFPSKRVYHQADAALPGYNPNEEHAALYGDVLYALRNDLNAIVNVSEPFALLKYRNPANNQWAMKVFRVASTNATFQFTYAGEAGQQLLLPAPLSLLPLCGASNAWVSGPGYKDHLGRLYARAAGLNNAGAAIVARYWYPLQPQFFYDLDRNGTPDAAPGDCVPWLDQRPGGAIGTPVDVTYNINWPTTLPTLQIGETLLGAKFGLPNLRRFAHAEVIFDEGDPSGTNDLESLVRLFDPLAPRTIQLRPAGSTNFLSGPGYGVFRVADADSLFAGISTANDIGALVFNDLPYALRSRLRYDPLNKNLTFRGLLDENQRYGGPENPLLLLNVLSPRERDRIKELSGNPAFDALIDALYDLTRNPNGLDLDGNELPDTTLLVGLTRAEDGDIVPEELADGPKVLTAGTARGSGFVTVVENDDPSLSGLPVTLHIIRVADGPFRGDIKVVQSDNVFDEKLTLRHSADFGGEPQNQVFEWYYKPVDPYPSAFPTLLPNGDIDDLRGWIQYSAFPPGSIGLNDITLGDGGTSSLLVLADNYFICRYRGYVINGATNWSDWVGIIGGGQAQLAEGWVKRVRDGLNPFEARSAAFHENETVTFASMLQQAGTRHEGDIAFNPSGGNINSIGLIEAYETVLRRARRLSIDGAPAINYQPANDALLLAAGFIADLYLLLGNEAFSDAADPTIGFRTGSAGYGTLAPSIFTFQNQVDSLLEEELALLRGRDDRSATVRLPPVYNRLFWNFTRDEGEVAYAQAYNITDQNNDGFLNETDARILYPQAHGDAWGHYLTATKTYYSLLQNPNFAWIPRSEPILLSGVPVNVDYLDERKFARAAAAKAKTGAEIVDLTYRLNYVDDPSGQYQGYKDTDPQRAWGVSEWAHRAGSGAFFDWVIANAVLPATDANPNHTGLTKIDRTTVRELDEIVAGYESVQAQVDKADGGLNPLGLAKNVVPFDIDPSLISAGKTHFEQIYDRAIEAVKNTVAVFDHANQLSQALRALQDTVTDFAKNTQQQERDYKNRLIEIFGYPYAGDIGAGRTYPSGYDGPDIYHYMYVNAVELNGDTAPPSQTLTSYYTRLEGNFHYFKDDLLGLVNTNLTTGEILAVSYPYSTADFAFVAPAVWGQRRAPGEVQMALSDMLQSEARLKQALVNYDNLLKEIDDQVDLLEARYQVRANTVTIRNDAKALNTKLSVGIGLSKITRGVFKGISDSIKDASEVALEALPKVVGTANDPTFAIRGVIKAGSTVGLRALRVTSGVLEIGEGVAQAAIDANKDAAQWAIQTEDYNFEVQQHLKEIEQLIRKEAALRAEAFELSEKVNQNAGRYQAALAKGLRLLEERIAFRKNAAAETQASRYQDMTFRIFRNDAIQKYRAQFDLAAQYVFLAAVAYDFETQLLGGRTGAGRAFLTDIVRQRALGEVVNGVPVAGRHGLADPLARLNQNFGVLKGQLGFNNPQAETGRFSLRNELFRMHDSSDAAWQAELKRHIVPNLWDIPEFRRYCRPFAPESAGPQPGLLIRFPTTVTFGLNYFGWPLGGGDSAYDSTLFATKVRSAGVWFSDYNGNSLSLTPRVFLVPAGADVMRSPSGFDLETREWRVVDQKIPVPFPIGFSSLQNPAWIPMNDSLSDTFADIRRYSSFRAYHDSGAFTPTETVSDTRLIGRSVWNTDWMLIVPGGTLLFDPNQGLETFVNSVSDIKIFFQTYAYSGN